MNNLDQAKIENLRGRVQVKEISGKRRDKEQHIIFIGPDKDNPEARSLPIVLKLWRMDPDKCGFFRVDVCRKTNRSYHQDGNALEQGVFFQLDSDNGSVVDSKYFFETVFVLFEKLRQVASEMGIEDFKLDEEEEKPKVRSR